MLFRSLLDTLRVFSIRIFKGSSPFTPDRNHVHHLLLDRGFKHTGVTFFCLFLNIGFIAIAYFGQSIGPTKLMLLMLVVAFFGLAMLYYYKKAKPTMFIAKHLDEEKDFATTPKIVTLTKEAAIVEQQ